MPATVISIFHIYFSWKFNLGNTKVDEDEFCHPVKPINLLFLFHL